MLKYDSIAGRFMVASSRKNVLLLFATAFSAIGQEIDPEQTVSPSTGEMSLNIPLGIVKGVRGNDYPITLSYNAGIRLHQSASSVGLGFHIGPGEAYPERSYMLQMTTKAGTIHKTGQNLRISIVRSLGGLG